MTTDLARPEDVSSALYHYLGTGDLSQLEPAQRAALYVDTCRSLGLNPRTRPFDWIEFYDPETKAKKLTFYPRSTCADQLKSAHRIRVETVEEKTVGTLYKVVVRGTMPDGRTEDNVAYVDLTDRDGNILRGQRYGDRLMKCHTKAKRRLILGMVGLMSPPDVDEMVQPKVVTVDGNGNIVDHPTEEQRHLAERPAVAAAIGAPTFEDHAAAVDVPDDLPDQRPDTASWETPKRTGPRPTFRASDEDVARWQKAFYASVSGLSLGSDDARHDFVAAYTRDLGWPEAKQCRSLMTMLRRMTVSEGNDFVAHVQAQMEGERAELLAAADDGSEPAEEF